jgi:hypothetical protein
LPGQQWKDYFADLTLIPDELNAKIDRAYKACDHLNHLARWYIREQQRSKAAFAALVAQAGPTNVNDYDKEQLQNGLKKINEANLAISAYLDEE